MNHYSKRLGWRPSKREGTLPTPSGTHATGRGSGRCFAGRASSAAAGAAAWCRKRNCTIGRTKRYKGLEKAEKGRGHGKRERRGRENRRNRKKETSRSQGGKGIIGGKGMGGYDCRLLGMAWPN